MPTAKPALQRLSARIDQRVERLGPKRKVRLTIFRGETAESARAAHRADYPAQRSLNVEFESSTLLWLTRGEAKGCGWA